MMKRETTFLTRATRGALAVCAILLVCFAAARAQTTTFTYQGRLTDSAAAASGAFDFEFRLFDQSGNQIGAAQTREDVSVTNGVFTVALDAAAFGATAFDGDARFLEIAVRRGNEVGAFTALAPRQPVTSAPYSIHSVSASAADSLSRDCAECVTDAKIQTVSGAKVIGAVGDAVNAAQAAQAANADKLGNVAASNYLQKTGGAITGNLSVGGVLSGDGSGLTNLPSSGGGSGGLQRQTVSGAAIQAQPNRGYILNSSTAQVVITLPTNPNVGDVVRVSGLSASGWRVSQNDNQFIAGADLRGLDSWLPRENVRNWWGIASSADGTKLAATVVLGQIYTSIDSGVTWTPRASVRNWRQIASSADGTKLAAANFGGHIYTSTDSGETWTPRESSRDWESIASSADGTKLAAADLGGQIYTSVDSGVNWASRETIRSWEGIASSADGSKLAAVVGNGRIYTSTNSGRDWTARETARNWFTIASSADGTKLAATGGDELIYLSIDSGVTWTPRESPRAWFTIASSADGSKLAATAYDNQIFTSRFKTSPGTAGYLTGAENAAIELLYVGGGRFTILSSSGAIESF